MRNMYFDLLSDVTVTHREDRARCSLVGPQMWVSKVIFEIGYGHKKMKRVCNSHLWNECVHLIFKELFIN